MSSIKVSVIDYPDRSKYQLRWTDSETGKVKTKSSGIKKAERGSKSKAEQAAGILAEKLEEGTAQVGARIRWEVFCEKYQEQYVEGLADSSRRKIQTLINHLNKCFKITYLNKVDEQMMTAFVSKLRKLKLSEDSIESNLRHLKSMLRWATRQKYLRVCPEVPKIQRGKKTGGHVPMKGRAIDDDEFLLMLEAVADVVPEDEVDDYIFYLRCLYASGLRLAESTELYWDRTDKLCPQFFKSQKPLLSIPGELEKGHTDRLMPLAPEFALLLGEVPAEQRKGPVFNLKGEPEWIGKRVSQIGKAAGIIVDQEKNKFASAHDLRRSFGDRWSYRVMPPDLKELMRHDSIETTLKYYVHRQATKTAEVCWEAYGKLESEKGSDALQIPAIQPKVLPIGNSSGNSRQSA